MHEGSETLKWLSGCKKGCKKGDERRLKSDAVTIGNVDMEDRK